jgi:hypothetical protein
LSCIGWPRFGWPRPAAGSWRSRCRPGMSARRPGRLSWTPGFPSNRGDIGLVIMAGAGCPCCARVWPGQAVACPRFLLPGAAGVPGVQGGPQGRRPRGDAQHPGGRGGGPVRLAGATRTAAAQPPPLDGPRSGPAAFTRRPFPSATVRNPRGCACRGQSAGGRGCSPRSRRRLPRVPASWWRTCAGTAARTPR